MKIAVLFDGAGLARLGLEQAGHECVGFELDPSKHALSQHVGSGQSILADVRDVGLSAFDAVWASPPCQLYSMARTSGPPAGDYAADLLRWSLDIVAPILWVENVVAHGRDANVWGTVYNAAQFEYTPRQNRNRVIGGRHPTPTVYHPYRRAFPGICPAIMATEYKGSPSDKRRASRWYGRKLTLDECAYHQGFTIPDAWYDKPDGVSAAAWRNNLYTAIGNGVPVYMARAFGEAVAGA